MKVIMDLKKPVSVLKHRWLTFLLYILLGIFIFSPAAKSWLLQQVISTGLFNAEIKKENKEKTTAPPFLLTYSEGNTLTTANLKGKVVFINFWASWCPPCRAEMPSLNQLYLNLREDKNYVFLFVNEDEDKSKGIDYIEKHDLSIPFYSIAGEISSVIYNGTLPTTVVLDKEGKIVLKHLGIGRYDTDEFMQQLKQLL